MMKNSVSVLKKQSLYEEKLFIWMIPKCSKVTIVHYQLSRSIISFNQSEVISTFLLKCLFFSFTCILTLAYKMMLVPKPQSLKSAHFGDFVRYKILAYFYRRGG